MALLSTQGLVTSSSSPGNSVLWPPLQSALYRPQYALQPGQPHSGTESLPALAVRAIDAAGVAGHGSNIIQVGHATGRVKLCTGSAYSLRALTPGHSIGLGQVHIRFLGLIHLAFVGEEDLGL